MLIVCRDSTLTVTSCCVVASMIWDISILLLMFVYTARQFDPNLALGP